MKDYLKIIYKITLFIFAVILTYLFIINILYKDKILPNTYISGLDVSGLTREEATEKIKILIPTNKNITLTSKSKDYIYNSNYFKFDYDLNDTVLKAYEIGRGKDFLNNQIRKFKSFFVPMEILFSYKFDNSLIDLEVSRIVGEEKISGRDASFKEINGQILIEDEKEGYSVDFDKLKIRLQNELPKSTDSKIELPFYLRKPEVTASDLRSIEKDVKDRFYRDIKLTFFEKEKYLNKSQVFKLLKVRKNKEGIYYDLNEDILVKYTDDIKQLVDKKPRALVTKFEGDRVLEFEINKEGSVLDEMKFRRDLREALSNKKSELKIATFVIGDNLPKEGYGINHLIGVGRSKFSGSINSRVFNLDLAAQKISGTLVSPGSEFSFLKTVGPMSYAEGFQAAYIISEGKTVLGEGGGVCQTSTTLFRAVLNSGLPVISRYPHAYRVGYYEQDAKPGLDASVFYPSLDFKFRNDTNKHILIQAEVDKNKYEMVFYIFGTKDGRSVELTEPVLTGFIPAPAPVYVDDPSLKPGEIKQVDFAASGITSVFYRKVKKDGQEIINEKYASTYSPWKAVYLRGPQKKN